jgi:hypothetical protein
MAVLFSPNVGRLRAGMGFSRNRNPNRNRNRKNKTPAPETPAIDAIMETVTLTLLCQIGHGVKEETFVYGSEGDDFDSDSDFDFDSQNTNVHQPGRMRFTGQSHVPFVLKIIHAIALMRFRFPLVLWPGSGVLFQEIKGCTHAACRFFMDARHNELRILNLRPLLWLDFGTAAHCP